MSLDEENKIKIELDIGVNNDSITLYPGDVNNPWLVDSLQDFLFLQCPECTFGTKEEENLVKNSKQVMKPYQYVYYQKVKLCKASKFLIFEIFVRGRPKTTLTRGGG